LALWLALLVSSACSSTAVTDSRLELRMSSEPRQERTRARDLGVRIGTLQVGPKNAITDVDGVAVGHVTVLHGEDARTGVTIIIPRQGENTFRVKLPCAVVTGNGFGKAAGFTQVAELGTLEAPIALTNTLAVGTVLDALVRRALQLPGNEDVRSINVVVGETNDGTLNDIRAFHVTREHVDAAWDAALLPTALESVAEGCVGAGTGTMCFGFKGGIGTSSRVVGSWTVGVLVQSNFGGALRIDGRPLPARSTVLGERESTGDGSCMIVIATNAPLDARRLERIAKRALLGLGRIGSVMSHGSGDYVIAFSTAEETLIRDGRAAAAKLVPDEALTPLFQAAVEATEEAVLNSLVAAVTTSGREGRVVHALDHARIRAAVSSN